MVSNLTLKRIARIVGLILLCIIIIGTIKIIPIVKEGYDLYRSAVESTPITERVEAVRKTEGYISINDISEPFIEALIESEDHRFYDHNGISLVATGRALLSNIQARSTVEGGSSLTQQLAKNLYFSFEKRYERKIAELFVAFELEALYDKNEILELYCNIAYFGEGQTGLGNASVYYYNVTADQLSSEQIQVLVGTLKSPNYRNPNAIKKNTE